MLRNILDATFRANPRYELVLLDHLPPAQQAALAGLRDDPDYYGILRPRADGAGLSVKAICRDSALLYLTLTAPGALPSYLRTLHGAQCNQAVAELVLDGVLELGQAGTFVSGAAAYDALYERATPTSESAAGRLTELSHAALRYGQALQLDDSAQLSARLYCYNRLPASPRWRRRFPDADAVARSLGLDANGGRRARLTRAWARAPRQSAQDPWRMWRARDERPALPADGTTWKLYVSPTVEHVAEALDATLTTLANAPAPAFKLGSDLDGLLRPDKLVIYFPSWAALSEAAAQLADALVGCPAHGVPFSAELASDGLLSWGMDPPRATQTLSWQARESWRLWLTNRLAVALVSAQTTESMVEPWQFALERLRLEGVDTDNWTPHAGLWSAEHTKEGAA
jgi:hypothetical protein